MAKLGRKSLKEMGVKRIAKRCPSCGVTKPIDDFCVKRKEADGHCTYCRDCVKQKARVYYLQNREMILSKAREKYTKKYPSLKQLYSRREKLEKRLEALKIKISEIESKKLGS